MNVVLAMIAGFILLVVAYGGLRKQRGEVLELRNEPEVVADNLEIPWEMVFLDKI